MPKTYHHLTKNERDLIAILQNRGVSLREIGRTIGRSPATISRELRRNAPPVYRGYYLPHRAEERATARARVSRAHERLRDRRMRAYVIRQIRRGWSPELIAGRLRELRRGRTISHEAIYQWVYADRKDLIPYLVRRHRRRFPRGHSRKHQKSHIPSRISIARRPKRVERRQEAGHWESDTVVSRRSKAAIQVSVERKTRYSRLAKLRRKTACETAMALNRRMSHYPRKLRKTFTYDNGSENVDHQLVNEILGTESYFCNPFHSWERGTNENTIGLVRRFLPKKTDFATVSNKDLRKIERWLNNRPRKCLNYQTPAEAFKVECCT